jgi:hypothetical protein
VLEFAEKCDVEEEVNISDFLVAVSDEAKDG